MKALVLSSILALTLQLVLCEPTSRDKLYKDKAKTYNKDAEPDGMNLKLGVTYLCGRYNRRSHVLTSRVFERYTWVDKRLAWSPKEYGGVTKVSVTDKEVWTPDVSLVNAIDSDSTRDHVNAVVLANGTVYWIPTATYHTLCTEHEDDDHYTCKLALGSWTYNIKEIPLELFAGGFDKKVYLKSCPWVVTDSHVAIKTNKYDCCPEPYQHLEVTLTIAPRPDDEDDHHEEEDDSKDHKKYHTPKRTCFWPHC